MTETLFAFGFAAAGCGLIVGAALIRHGIELWFLPPEVLHEMRLEAQSRTRLAVHYRKRPLVTDGGEQP